MITLYNTPGAECGAILSTEDIDIAGGETWEDWGSCFNLAVRKYYAHRIQPHTTIVTIAGGEVVGEPCVFPFVYNGIEYTSCTDAGSPDRPWCATGVDAQTKAYTAWGYCPEEEERRAAIVTIAGGAVVGEPCVFPFVYKSVEYTSCIDVDRDNGLWCATGVEAGTNVYKSPEWGYCPELFAVQVQKRGDTQRTCYMYSAGTVNGKGGNYVYRVVRRDKSLCRAVALNYVIYDGYTYQTLLEADVNGADRYNDAEQTYTPMPAGFSVAPDDQDIVDNVIAPYYWDVWRLCTESKAWAAKHYGTNAGMLKDSKKKWESNGNVYRIIPGDPWYRLLIRAATTTSTTTSRTVATTTSTSVTTTTSTTVTTLTSTTVTTTTSTTVTTTTAQVSAGAAGGPAGRKTAAAVVIPLLLLAGAAVAVVKRRHGHSNNGTRRAAAHAEIAGEQRLEMIENPLRVNSGSRRARGAAKDDSAANDHDTAEADDGLYEQFDNAHPNSDAAADAAHTYANVDTAAAARGGTSSILVDAPAAVYENASAISSGSLGKTRSAAAEYSAAADIDGAMYAAAVTDRGGNTRRAPGSSPASIVEYRVPSSAAAVYEPTPAFMPPQSSA